MRFPIVRFNEDNSEIAWWEWLFAPVVYPILFAFLLILASPLLISGNWFLGATWIGMAVLDVGRRIRIEEAMLLGHFGDEYRVYMLGTGRVLPRIFRASDSRA